jgi:HAD superfamily hydrolase (TIGR01549 family)
LLKAVIFDMDGVIIDSEPMHARAAVLALQKYNLDVPLDYIYRFIGTTANFMCQTIINDFHIDATPEELLTVNDAMKEFLLKKEGYTAVPYVFDLIKDLYEHGVKLIIASSSPASSIESVMDFFQIRNYFEGYVSGTAVTHPKPAPDIFLAAAKQLGVNPQDCIVIEDSFHGVTAAAAAGIVSIGFVNPNSGNQDLKQCAILVEGFDEIDYHFVNQTYLHAHMLPATILTTERLMLRELSAEDIERLCVISNKPEVLEYVTGTGSDVALEKAKHEAYVKNVYHFYGYGLWGIFTLEEQLLIGRAGIEYRRIHQEDIYEIGYFIDPEHQGKGYATECVRAILSYAFNTLALPKITAIIPKNNFCSQRLAEKIGMRCSGELTHQGRACYTYDINREEFHP